MTPRSVSPWLVARSIAWTLLPFIVAGYVPWTFLGLSDVRIDAGDPVRWLGLVLMAAGATLLLTCIWEFAASGRGTLGPPDPPKELVVRGLYRYVRNPMYLSVATLLIGEELLVRRMPLFVYFVIWFSLVNVFVLAYEEPALRSRFGASYDEYAKSVGRWLPRPFRQ
ncbi:MAG: isoprenylcysteine carboxylmethyltransferase family protein [Acidobacteria bacterium]|nr:isoprenylcysteine carboxylmethyltransferase family protein [Acidobacteriota bacterium]